MKKLTIAASIAICILLCSSCMNDVELKRLDPQQEESVQDSTSTEESSKSETSTAEKSTSEIQSSSSTTTEAHSTEEKTRSNATEQAPSLSKSSTSYSETISSEENKATTSDPNAIVDKVYLQIAPQIQQEWNWCAPATVSMILSYREVYVSQAQLAAEMGTEETFGTHNADAIRVLNKHLFGYEYPEEGAAGYRLATVSSGAKDSDDMYLFIERLKQNIADGYPMYFTFDVSKIYPGLEGEHNVIGIGYSLNGNGDIVDIHYIDPDPGQQDPIFGGWKTVTPEELLDAMTTCVEPNYGW